MPTVWWGYIMINAPLSPGCRGAAGGDLRACGVLLFQVAFRVRKSESLMTSIEFW